MKELVIVSGKGGTGKTSVAASLAVLAERKVLADCDVDAAHFHILLSPSHREKGAFMSGHTAVIDGEACSACGECVEACRFHAIGEDFRVDPAACEGCGVCAHVCPTGAARLEENHAGDWFVSDTARGPLVHARLRAAQENSGKLVALVRKKAKELAEDGGYPLILVDGPPGIGCPVISSITGCHRVLVVAEPTVSGFHDLERVMQVTGHFKIPTLVCVNKWDLRPVLTETIEAFCRANGAGLVGKIAYDEIFLEALARKRTVVEFSDGDAARSIRQIWDRIRQFS
jgi:MinD superfamily P-loop ATPase